MEVINCIKERRSIRKFTEQVVGHDIMEDIITAATFSSSWKNTQVVRHILIEDRDLLDEIANKGVLDFEYNQKTINNAPAMVLVTYVTGRSGYEKDGSFSTSKEDRWEMFDAGIATQTFCLAAHSYGVGSVVMGIFDEEIIANVVKLPEGQKIAAIIPIGYPKFAPEAPPRKAVESLLSYR